MTFDFPEPDLAPLRGGPVLRWGIIGPGEIANDFTATLHANSDQRVVAVGSRSAERADAFARTHGVPNVHASYEALVDDPEVDVVYVATPHPQHAEHALLAIAAGKHVLVEKPFATSEAEAQRIADAARAAGVFAMEALWTRFLPHTRTIDALRERGDLGEVVLATVDVGWKNPLDPGSRMMDPDAGGGALLDAGVYGLWFAQWATGAVATVRATGRSTERGVDLQSVAAIATTTGAHATVATSILTGTDGLATIGGTAASIRFTDHFVFPASFELRIGDDRHRWQEPTGLTGREGLVWQAVAVAADVAAGRTESALRPLDDSIALMRTLDDVRRMVRDPG
ncbi:Gfo/Idh/MocA family protein [Curtobacterium sp. RRHDQ10]|uniref:Gfo/Idh/MocA family protein n=1 Tax=Curtobacterium phyllosphaerae TaxID=3413379 RepID=UPI003BF224A7